MSRSYHTSSPISNPYSRSVQSISSRSSSEVRSAFQVRSAFALTTPMAVSNIDDPDGRVKHLLGVSEGFLSDFTAGHIEKKLETWNVKRVMGEAGRRRVRVTKSGPTVAVRE